MATKVVTRLIDGETVNDAVAVDVLYGELAVAAAADDFGVGVTVSNVKTDAETGDTDTTVEVELTDGVDDDGDLSPATEMDTALDQGDARVLGTANVASLSGPQTVALVALIAEDVAVLQGQTDPTENGPWVVKAGAWERPVDYVAEEGQWWTITEGIHARLLVYLFELDVADITIRFADPVEAEVAELVWAHTGISTPESGEFIRARQVDAMAAANVVGTLSEADRIFTITATGAFTLDGVLMTVGKSMYLPMQTDPTANGRWVCIVAGDTGISAKFVRDTVAFVPGAEVVAISGTARKGFTSTVTSVTDGVPSSTVPVAATGTPPLTVVANEAAMLALPDFLGQTAVRTDLTPREAYIQLVSPASTLANWQLKTGDVASDITFVPSGDIVETNVQTAMQGVRDRAATASGAALTAGNNAQTTANAALPKAGGTMTGALNIGDQNLTGLKTLPSTEVTDAMSLGRLRVQQVFEMGQVRSAAYCATADVPGSVADGLFTLDADGVFTPDGDPVEANSLVLLPFQTTLNENHLYLVVFEGDVDDPAILQPVQLEVAAETFLPLPQGIVVRIGFGATMTGKQFQLLKAGAAIGVDDSVWAQDSGTYTPAAANGANVGASTPGLARWHRVGNVLHVSGQISIDPTAALTPTDLTLTLPIASALSNANQASGVMNNASLGVGGTIVAEPTTDTVTLAFVSTADVSNLLWTYAFDVDLIV